jgi:two-component system sensor histidine kinase DevS
VGADAGSGGWGVRDGAPGRRLTAALLLGLVAVAAVLLLTLSQPWLGLHLRWDDAARAAKVTAAQGPAAQIPVDATVLAVLDDQGRVWPFEALDFVIEPDGNVATYDDYRRFLARQSALAALQAQPVFRIRTADGQDHAIVPLSTRPLWTLPADFWIQIVVGFFAWLIAAAVWAFRPRDAAARYLLLSGLSTLMFAPGAAVYTTRELAIPLAELLVLKTMNFGGGLVYCGTMVALLWHYPRRLGPGWVSVGVVLGYVLWFLVQAAGAFDSMLVGRRWPVFAALAATLLLSIVQWVGSRRDPVARAALQWFLLSWLLGTSVFVVLTMVPQLYGVDTARTQGYGFALFLLVYGGLAFGILRFRLFELGEWWFRTLTWVLGAMMLVGLDLLLLLGLQFSFTVSLSLALVVSGFLWLPLRGWLWMRLMQRGQVREHDVFKSAIHVALAPDAEQQAARWRAMLRRLYAPLLIEDGGATTAPTIADDGLRLRLPAVGSLPPLQLVYPGEGRRLFTPRDVTMALQLADLLQYAQASREAYGQGVRDERERIARDLHDELGSQLLTAMYQPQIEPARASIGQAISTLRTILDQLSGRRLLLSAVISDLRHDLGQRLESAGLTLHWPVDADPVADPELDSTVYRHYASILRELGANIVRHAGARAVDVRVRLEGRNLVTEIEDDGHGFRGAGSGGYGLGNLEARLSQVDGRLEYLSRAKGSCARITIPLSERDEALSAADPG